MSITASDWMKGISLSILASVIGGASKLAIRKSWLMQHDEERRLGARDTRSAETRPNATGDAREGLHDDSYMAVRGNGATMPPRDQTRQDAPSGRDVSRESFSEEADTNSGGDDGERIIASSSSTTVDLVSEMRAPPTTRRDTVRIIAWILRGSGMIGMTFLNPACSVMAMNYASPSILAPFSGLTLVWIVLFSQPLIHERPTTRQVVAASLIILGEVLVAVFGDHTNDEDMTIDDVTKSYHYPPFIMYTVGTVLWMLLLLYWMTYSPNPTLKRFAWGVAGGSITGFQNFLKGELGDFVVSLSLSFWWQTKISINHLSL